ncbi:MAG: DUF1015 domain-containing protein, partial [Candidatus Omnitrophota bacterium]|nr:DUF1015 domain-containing protein [Candidatus Omnitrophota bacterium]
RSRDLFKTWLKDRVMINDDKDAIYIYSLEYKKASALIEQIGFIGLMGLEPEGAGKVLPHENTLAAPKEDRLSLTRSVKANLSPIFVLYEDKTHGLTRMLKKFISENKALIDVKSDGVRHRIWKFEDQGSIKVIEDIMAHKDIFIADGHHRYEASRMYLNETNSSALPQDVKDNSKYMMVYFVEMDERMLTILPAHRVVKDIGGLNKEEILEKLNKYFHVDKIRGLKALLAKMKRSAKSHMFGMYPDKKDYYLLRLKSVKESDKAIKNHSTKAQGCPEFIEGRSRGIRNKPKPWKALDVSILHQFIIQHVLGIRDDDDNIDFFHSAEETVESVDSGKFKLAFFLNPTKVSEVKKIARIGERMPRKATYFYPKPLSGLVINKF